MQGQLFSHDFLTRGILETVPWQACDKNQLDAFATELRRAYGIVAADSALNEAQTESELIEPVLALLGWENLPQINMSQSGREDVPDFLLFADAAAKARAFAEPSDDRTFGSFRTRDWILAYRQRIDDGVLSHDNHNQVNLA